MKLPIEPEMPPIRVNAEGTALVGASRVPLDTVVHFHQQGATPEVIVRKFPTLELADVYGAVEYYLRHFAEVDEYLREREQVAAAVRAEIERHVAQEPQPNPVGRRGTR